MPEVPEVPWEKEKIDTLDSTLNPYNSHNAKPKNARWNEQSTLPPREAVAIIASQIHGPRDFRICDWMLRVQLQDSYKIGISIPYLKSQLRSISILRL